MLSRTEQIIVNSHLDFFEVLQAALHFVDEGAFTRIPWRIRVFHLFLIHLNWSL